MTTTPDTPNPAPTPTVAYDDLVAGCGDEPMDHAAILAALTPQLNPAQWFITGPGLGEPLG